MIIPGEIGGKAALITGSTSGIGLGVARAMAQAGANIILNGFGDADEIESIRGQIEQDFKVQAFYHPANMTKPEEISDLIAYGQDKVGPIEILVNNAGIQFVRPVEDFPPEKWDEIIAINMSSSFHTIRHVVKGMADKGWGRIINIASVHGLVASPFKSAYITAKHGILGLTKTVALEQAQNNVTCNAICPGYVFTPLVEGQIADTAKARNISEDEVVSEVLLKAQHTKKFTTIEDVAATALFLCSDAAGNITGTHIDIDGGWTAA